MDDGTNEFPMTKTFPRSTIWIVRCWDILVWATIFFPFATGGIWWHADGLHLELTQINGPVIALGLLGLLLDFRFSGALMEASSLRLLVKTWDAWRAWVDRKPHAALWSAVAILTLLWSGAAISRHHGFQTSNADMGIFTNGIWNFTHGNGFVSSMKSGANLLTDHQSPVFMLFSPFFWLAPYAETLFVLQSLTLLTGGVAVFWLARQYLPARHPAIYWLPIAYWFFHPTRSASRFDFHPEVTMLPLYLWALVGIQAAGAKKRALGLLAFVLALGAKESAGPVGMGICLAWLAGAAPEASRRFTRMLAALLLPLSGAVFVFDTTVVPGLFGKDYRYDSAYFHLGGKTTQILLAPFRDFPGFLRALLGEGRAKLFLASIAPLMFLPLLNWRAFLASLPGYLMILLTFGGHRISLGYHYSIEFSAGIFWSLPCAILALEKWRARASLANPRFLALAAIFLFGTYGRGDLYFIRAYPISEHQRWVKREVFPCLTQESFAAPDPYTPHLSLRPWVHFIPILEKPEGSGDYVSCVILEDNWPLGENDILALDTQIKHVGYREVYSCNGLKILASPRANAQCLRCVPACKN